MPIIYQSRFMQKKGPCPTRISRSRFPYLCSLWLLSSCFPNCHRVLMKIDVSLILLFIIRQKNIVCGVFFSYTLVQNANDGQCHARHILRFNLHNTGKKGFGEALPLLNYFPLSIPVQNILLEGFRLLSCSACVIYVQYNWSIKIKAAILKLIMFPSSRQCSGNGRHWWTPALNFVSFKPSSFNQKLRYHVFLIRSVLWVPIDPFLLRPSNIYRLKMISYDL